MVGIRTRRSAGCFVLAFAAAALLITPNSYARGGPKIGDVVDDFTLIDVHTSQAVSLSEFDEAEALVLMFIATQCPVSNDYNERMAQLFEDYKESPVQFIGINPNREEAFREVLEHAQTNELAFPVVKDVDNKIADRFDAAVTPEVYLLQPSTNGDGRHLILRYHGAIDDSQAVAKVERRYLREALDAVLAGGDVAKSETKAFGCSIKRVKKQRAPYATP